MKNWSPTKIVACGLVALGTIASIIVAFNENSNGYGTFAANMAVIGVILVATVSVNSKGRSIEEAYRFGFDLGYEEGYKVGTGVVQQESERKTTADGGVVPLRSHPRHRQR